MLYTEMISYIYTMVVALDGKIWMGFSNGVLKIDPLELAVLGTNIKTKQPSAISTKISSYPNPFNNTTIITYSISNPSYSSLEVYSMTGQKVATLLDDFLSAGDHTARFDGGNFASGMYFYRFEAGDFVKTGRMTLVK